jgi:N-glycosylase/DNA lyase
MTRELIKQIKELKKSQIGKDIEKRLNEFSSIGKKGSNDWFVELCFCLLTANTSAELGLRIQNEFGFRGFTSCLTEIALAKKLKAAKYRFYNRRAHFIFLACRYKEDIKEILLPMDYIERREWLVLNIKGIGYKESSHFLRNIGFFDYAILDKHIIRLLHDSKLISKVPDSLNRNRYMEYEEILSKICDKVGMSQGELDMYLWYIKTGQVLK